MDTTVRKLTAAALCGVAVAISVPSAAIVLPAGTPPSLRSVRAPEPANLSKFVKNKQAAIVLGKALFWDMQVGSDGIQSCATCHSHAGVDDRMKNSFNPGSLARGEPFVFNLGPPNFQATLANWPFAKAMDDVLSSQGVRRAQFVDIVPGQAEELKAALPDTLFNVGGVNTRRVEPRQAPTMINAVFNYRNFWDARASNYFNGSSVLGRHDPSATILRVGRAGKVESVKIELDFSSLASQAVGPPVSVDEMSYVGRTWPKIGKKMLSLRPLAKQAVHPADSVLGPFRDRRGSGLIIPYDVLVAAAFAPEYWAAPSQIVTYVSGVPQISRRPNRPLSTGEYTLMEANFALFFGLAVQLYQATLISDETRFDDYVEGDENALTSEEQDGLAVFTGQGRCINCHGGPLFSNATTPFIFPGGTPRRIMRVDMPDSGQALYDTGFYNIAIRATAEDLGVGGLAPSGVPLSYARMATDSLYANDPRFTEIRNDVSPPAAVGERLLVGGTFKAAILRNVELSGPFFHSGGRNPLSGVLGFYNGGAGGSFGNEQPEKHPDITSLNLTQDQRSHVVAFLTSLTDERVRYRRAPFDHPELWIPNGHVGDTTSVVAGPDGLAADEFAHIPAVGAGGSVEPLLPFGE